jgi:trimethylguanosine synthase
MEPYSLDFLYQEYTQFSKFLALYLPRTSDLRQLAKIIDDEKKVNVMHYCIEGASKALCVYYGKFDMGNSTS